MVRRDSPLKYKAVLHLCKLDLPFIFNLKTKFSEPVRAQVNKSCSKILAFHKKINCLQLNIYFYTARFILSYFLSCGG